MLADGTAERLWCALILCGLLSACAAPGDPTPINSLAFLRPQPGPANKLAAAAGRPLTHPAPKPTAVAVLPRATPPQPAPAAAGASDLRTGSSESTTVAASPPAAAAQPQKATAALPLVPAPATAPPPYSPLSPVANPVAFVPPGGDQRRATAALPGAHEAVLAPGPSLCDLNDGATAADVVLNAKPCPASLRPTLKPSDEPAQ